MGNIQIGFSGSFPEKRNVTIIIANSPQVTTSIFTEMSLFCYEIRVNFMQAAGIIAEYNPLHSGHTGLMARIRRRLGPETYL